MTNAFDIPLNDGACGNPWLLGNVKGTDRGRHNHPPARPPHPLTAVRRHEASSNAFLTVVVPPALALQLWARHPLLNLNSMLSSNFVVQYSTNLATNWMNLLSLTNLPASLYLFLDSGGVGKPARFYRAFMQ
jgi:hypothetical protein